MPRVSIIVTSDDESFAMDSDMGPIHHALMQDVLRLAKSGATPHPAHCRLSGREWDCIRLLSEGNSNKQIAIKLGVAVPTVKCHLAVAYRVLGVTSRLQAAIAAGAIQQPPPVRSQARNAWTWKNDGDVVVEHIPVPRGLAHA